MILKDNNKNNNDEEKKVYDYGYPNEEEVNPNLFLLLCVLLSHYFELNEIKMDRDP